jgi:hypothetical protein
LVDELEQNPKGYDFEGANIGNKKHYLFAYQLPIGIRKEQIPNDIIHEIYPPGNGPVNGIIYRWVLRD